MTTLNTPKNYNILIVDDEEEICTALKEFLEIQGWNIHVCHNGCDAVTFVKSKNIDIVISDIRMPKCTGYDFLQKLDRDTKKSLTIIMMSAYSDYDEEQLHKLGATMLLQKPLSGTQVIDYLNNMPEK